MQAVRQKVYAAQWIDDAHANTYARQTVLLQGMQQMFYASLECHKARADVPRLDSA